MRPLRYSINVTLDGCCDHRAMLPDEDMHRHAAENIAQANALLLGRVTYELMGAGWRPFARTGARPDWMEPWMEPFARTIDAAKKYVGTLFREATMRAATAAACAPAAHVGGQDSAFARSTVRRVNLRPVPFLEKYQ